MNTFGMDTQLLSLKEALELVISRYRDAGWNYRDIWFEFAEMTVRMSDMAAQEENAEAQP